jgi:hypothetical protein
MSSKSAVPQFHRLPRYNRRRGERMPSGLSFLICETMKDFLVLKVLQAIVKEEDERFLFGRPKEHEAGLLLDCRRRKHLGLWSGQSVFGQKAFGKIATTQYSVRCSLSRMSEGRDSPKQMVTHWVEQHADKLNSKFGIEAPERESNCNPSEAERQ